MVTSTLSFISKTITLSDDNPHRLTDDNIPFYEINLHCYNQDCYYGDGVTMGAIITANDIASFKNGNMRDIFIQNKTAGQNTTVYAVATVPHPETKNRLEI